MKNEVNLKGCFVIPKVMKKIIHLKWGDVPISGGFLTCQL